MAVPRGQTGAVSDDFHNDLQQGHPFNVGPSDQQQHQRQTTWPGWRNVKSSHGGEAVFFGRSAATTTMADLHLMEGSHPQGLQDQWSSQGSFESIDPQQQQHIYQRPGGFGGQEVMTFDQHAAMQASDFFPVPHQQYHNQSPQVVQGEQFRMPSQHTPSPHHSQEGSRGFQSAGPHLEGGAVAGPSNSRPTSRGQPLRHRHSSLQMTSMALQRQSPLRSLHLKTESPIPEISGERMAEVPGRIPRTGPTLGSAAVGLYMTAAGSVGNGPHGFVRSFSGPQQRHSSSISPASNLNSPSWTSPSAFPTPGSAGFSPMTSTSSNDSRMMAAASPAHSRDPSMDGWSQGMTSASSSTSDFSQTGLGGSIPRPKRKTKLLNIDRKRICEHAAAHPKMKQDDLAAVFGIERSTVSKVLKDKERWLNIEDDSETAKIVKHRSARFPEVETPLTHWAHQMIASGEFVSDTMLRSKALEIAGLVGGPASKFKASSGWIDKFRDRANLPKGLGSAYRGSISGQSSSSYASFASSSASSAPLWSPISTIQMQFAQQDYQQQQHASSLMPSSSRRPSNPAASPSMSSDWEMIRRGSTFSQHGQVQEDQQASSQPTLQPTDGIDVEMRPRLSSSVEPMSEHDATVAATPTSKQKRHYDAMAGGSMSFFGPLVPFPSSSSGQVEIPERLDPAVWSPDSFSPEGVKRRRGITGLGLPTSAYGPSCYPAASPTSHRYQSQHLLGSQQEPLSSFPRRPDTRGSTLTGAFNNNQHGGDSRGLQSPSLRRRQSRHRSNEASDDGPMDSFLLSPSLRDRPISPLRRFRASELSRSGTIVASMYGNLKDGSKTNEDENLYASPGSSTWDAAIKHAEGGDLASALPTSTFPSPILRPQRPQPMRESRSINGSPTRQTGYKSADERETEASGAGDRQGNNHSPRRQGRQYRRSHKNSSSRPGSDREAATTVPSPSEAQAHANVVQAFREQQGQLQSDGDGMAFSMMNLAPSTTLYPGSMSSPGGNFHLPSVLRRSNTSTMSSPFVTSPFSEPQGPSTTAQQQVISVDEARRSLNVVLQFLEGSGSNALNDEVSAARGQYLDLGAALQQGELWNRLATLTGSGEQQAGNDAE